MKKVVYSLLALLVLTLSACDDGPIEKTTVVSTGGKVVKAEGTLSGFSTWSNRYDVALAGFTTEADNESLPYASISKVVSADSTGRVSVVLSNIASDVTTVDLCVMNRLRQRVVAFTSIDVSNAAEGDTVRMDLGTIDASMLAAIQKGIFDASCTACHGANGNGAANLNLTSGKSYASLVGHASTKLPGQVRVVPGSSESSVLWQVLYGDASSTWGMKHGDMLNKERAAGLLQLLQDWIDDGAQH